MVDVEARIRSSLSADAEGAPETGRWDPALVGWTAPERPVRRVWLSAAAVCLLLGTAAMATGRGDESSGPAEMSTFSPPGTEFVPTQVSPQELAGRLPLPLAEPGTAAGFVRVDSPGGVAVVFASIQYEPGAMTSERAWCAYGTRPDGGEGSCVIASGDRVPGFWAGGLGMTYMTDVPVGSAFVGYVDDDATASFVRVSGPIAFLPIGAGGGRMTAYDAGGEVLAAVGPEAPPSREEQPQRFPEAMADELATVSDATMRECLLDGGAALAPDSFVAELPAEGVGMWDSCVTRTRDVVAATGNALMDGPVSTTTTEGDN
jgi:hypothetical protein